MSTVINLDQVGFVSMHKARDNTIKTQSLISYCQTQKVPLCLLSLDALFGNSWKQLSSKLVCLGFIQKILVLYSCPTAHIMVNALLYTPVHISNGTLQGCPLSLILYIMAMEHLTNLAKVSLFEDDLLLYVSNPRIAFPFLLLDLEHFHSVSNFKVNTSKSCCLSLPPGTQEFLNEMFSFQWA